MPRKTPVREIQKEEPAPSSPLRRSSRISNSSPVPTRVLTRRNSATETSSAVAPKVTRTRRSSLTHEEATRDSQPDKRKSLSAVKTTKASLSSNKTEKVEEEPVQKTRTRATSVPKEQPPEAKKPIGRSKSASETSEIGEESAKKVTRSRPGPLSKKIEDVSAKNLVDFSKDISASTPIKLKTSPENLNASLDSIAEGTESGSPEEKQVEVKKRKTEASKIDFDLSVINEASLTEGEISPEKKKNDEDNLNIESKAVLSKEESESIQDEKGTVSEKSDGDKKAVTAESTTSPKKNSSSGMSDVSGEGSFSLQLSSSVFETSSKQETDRNDATNKENVRPNETPVTEQPESEPMDVDDSVIEPPSPAKTKTTKSPKESEEATGSDVEQKAQAVEKITNEIDEFLKEETSFTLKTKSDGKHLINVIENKTVVVGKVQGDDVSPKKPTVEQKLNNSMENKVAVVMLTKLSKDDSSSKNPESVSKETKHIQPSEAKELEIKKNGNEETKVDDVDLVATTASKQEKAVEKIVSPKKSSPTKKAISDVENDIQTNKVTPKKGNLGVSPKSSENKNTEKASVSDQTEIITEADNTSAKLKSVSSPAKKGDPERSSEKEVEGSPITEETCPVEPNENNESSVQESATLNQVNNSKNSDETVKTDSCDISGQESIVEVTKNPEEAIIPEKETDDNDAQGTGENAQPVNSADEESSVVNVDLEIESINTTNQAEETDVAKANEEIDLCGSDSDENSSSGDETGYKSPHKKIRTHRSISDDEIIVARDKLKEKRPANLLDRSINSKYTMPLDDKKVKIEEVIVVSENEDENNTEEIVEVTNKTTDEVKVANQDTDDKNQENGETETENSILANSFRKRSLDRTSITLQETIKAGQDTEKSLSGRIHKVVDLFCAGLKNKSDVSVNVSLEYTGQFSDNEDENTDKADVIDISFVASEVTNSENENLRGSKRRKICSDDLDVKLDEKEETMNSSTIQSSVSSEDKSPENKKRRSTIGDAASPKISVPTDGEETTKSAQKKKKRKSTANLEEEPKSEQKDGKRRFSVEGGISPKISASEKKKRRRSVNEEVVSEPLEENPKARRSLLAEDVTNKESPSKRKMNNTPLESSGDAKSIETESSEDDETDASAICLDESRQFSKLLSTEYADSDPNDTTWVVDEEVDSSRSEVDTDDAVDSDVDDEKKTLVEEQTEKKKPRENLSSSDDSVFTSQAQEKKNKNKNRKIFHLSRFIPESLLDSTESIEKEEQKPKGKKKRSGLESASKQQVLKNTKKSNKAGFSKSKRVNMLPESSEIEKQAAGKKRKLQSFAESGNASEDVQVDSESAGLISKKKIKKKTFTDLREKLSRVKPSTANKVAFSFMKPSTKTSSGWQVNTF